MNYLEDILLSSWERTNQARIIYHICCFSLASTFYHISCDFPQFCKSILSTEYKPIIPFILNYLLIEIVIQHPFNGLKKHAQIVSQDHCNQLNLWRNTKIPLLLYAIILCWRNSSKICYFLEFLSLEVLSRKFTVYFNDREFTLHVLDLS